MQPHFFGGPYTLISTTILLKYGVNPISLILVILVSGLGASTSKLVMYALGLAMRKPLKNNKNILFLHKISNRVGFYLGMFILSILPIIPFDDYVFLAVGIAKINLAKLFLISIAGKIIKSAIEINIELAGIGLISSLLDINALEISIISSIAFVILGIIMFKIDWEEILNKGKNFLRDKLKINI